MNKLKPSLQLFLICLSINGFSQYDNFNLSKYNLPDLDRKALETNYSFTGSNHNLEEFGYNSYYRTHFDLNYNRFQNTQEYQKETDLRFNFDYYFISDKENGNLHSKRSYLSPNLFYQGEYRHYNDRLYFFETDLTLSGQYNREAGLVINSPNINEKSSENRFDLVFFVPIKFGKGRIEPIQDLRHAIYLFEELAKIEKMTADKSEEQIVEFAELISKLKNKRFFDSRIRRIAEITSIDSFLISKGHVSSQDAEYFTTLSDYWAYGNRPFRNAGTRVSAVIMPGFYFPGLFYDIILPFEEYPKYLNSLLILDGGIEVKHEKPINLYWQNTLDFNCYVGLYDGRYRDLFDTEEYNIRTPNFKVSYSQNIGFYPNTRTDINFGYSVSYLHMFDNDLSNVFAAARFATNLSINYYISPKIRLNAYSTLYYYWQDSSLLTLYLNKVNNEYLLNHFNLGLSGYNITLINELSHRFQISLVYNIF